MTNQALLEKIEKRLKVTKGQQPSVILPLNDWQLVEDMILELSSPRLAKSILRARSDYKKNKGIEYKPAVR